MNCYWWFHFSLGLRELRSEYRCCTSYLAKWPVYMMYATFVADFC